MTRSTTRLAGIGAGTLLALGLFAAAPAGATDGARADANVSLETEEAINQKLGVVNQVCADAGRTGDAVVSALAAEHGITVSSESTAGLLNLQVSLPALTDALPSLGSLPLLGSAASEVDATRPLQITCAASAGGTGLGLTAAGLDVLVDAVAPGVDVSGLNLEIPVVDAGASATTSGAALPADTSVSATAAAPASTTTTAAVEAAPATTSDSTSVSGGTLARTGAGIGGLGLLGGALIGGGRLLGFGRRFLGIG
jgi:hypothetical protein